ncbi:MAG: transcriptional repressor [Bacteroidales bacterium]|nr:transcriptional repressor [Fournierella massiliensis]MCF2557353.1 transcriptional repressor [Fournierella massiliensis]MCI6739280.1 transcriptional repressor [Bacteroidales bacterium]
MAHYQTAQKKLLLDFLREHSRQAFTIEELAAALEGREHAPGKSTLYRLMPLLVQEGRVKRFVRGTSRQFLYQMMGESCRTHLHLKCSICGQMVHMGHEESLELVRMIDKKYHFSVSEGDTVLFGLCENCRTAPA